MWRWVNVVGWAGFRASGVAFGGYMHICRCDADADVGAAADVDADDMQMCVREHAYVQHLGPECTPPPFFAGVPAYPSDARNPGGPAYARGRARRSGGGRARAVCYDLL